MVVTEQSSVRFAGMLQQHRREQLDLFDLASDRDALHFHPEPEFVHADDHHAAEETQPVGELELGLAGLEELDRQINPDSEKNNADDN